MKINTLYHTIKEINEEIALNFKNVCINFYKNFLKQANKKIIDESEFNRIEEISFEIFIKKTEYEKYLEVTEVYTYAKIKDTYEEVVNVKGKWKSFTKIKNNITVNKKHFYSEYKVMDKNKDELIDAPMTIDLKSGQIHLKFEGTSKNRIKDLEFVISILKYEYIIFDNIKFE